MSINHYYKPKERKAREELCDFLLDKIDDNYYEEFIKLLDRYRQAVFNHAIARERDNEHNRTTSPA